MGNTNYLGELEQMLLLTILRAGEDATGYMVRTELEETAGREISKGTFYVTLDRMKEKGFVAWEVREPSEGPSRVPQRHFSVTPTGRQELRKSLGALRRLTAGLDDILPSES